ncbi:SpoIIIAH-like family protein [Clostridium cadaveris]|uniref:SpoIIIAH-like family protein n=1 Tax=Clostridium cadaveris TaxID=1529 RepID=UPI000C07BB2B|nr:SpoIIIAH-like family protein [Clostridium cadaveris]
MNKKQAGIILALLALIVIAGVAATKVNGPMGDVADSDWNFGQTTASVEENKEENYFDEQRTQKITKDSESVEALKTIMNNEKVPSEERASAAKKQEVLITKSNNENRIETTLKTKGFKDVLCIIEEDKVRVIVKSSEELTVQQRQQIQEVATSISKLPMVEIEQKK